ncbi:MAG: NUDIX domain-containing protein [Colwellia sp.]|nr:NUDIX domain-containing protein [Colwellia sp.]
MKNKTLVNEYKDNSHNNNEYHSTYSANDMKIHEVKAVFNGFFNVNCYQLSHKLFNGGNSEIISREVFERGDAVVLMPYDPLLDQVVLLEQFRPGVIRSGESPWLLEFVAGMFDGQETPEEVAVREAKEEADLAINPESLIKIMTYFSSPGGMSEKIHLYAVCIDSSTLSNKKSIHGLVEEGEDILMHVMSKELALRLLKQGKINNASTIIGLQWLALNYKSLQDNSVNRS